MEAAAKREIVVFLLPAGALLPEMKGRAAGRGLAVFAAAGPRLAAGNRGDGSGSTMSASSNHEQGGAEAVVPRTQVVTMSRGERKR